MTSNVPDLAVTHWTNFSFSIASCCFTSFTYNKLKDLVNALDFCERGWMTPVLCAAYCMSDAVRHGAPHAVTPEQRGRLQCAQSWDAGSVTRCPQLGKDRNKRACIYQSNHVV